jgi:hypothetical protein
VETTQGDIEVGSPAQELSQPARASMQLKLLLALAIEKLVTTRVFSPWVYRLELQSLGAWQENDRLGLLMSKPGCRQRQDAVPGPAVVSHLVTDSIC